MRTLDRLEWKKGYPIKKVAMVMLWVLFFVTSIQFTIKGILYGVNSEQLVTIVTGGLICTLTFKPLKRYILIQYHCMPYIHLVLSKKEINQLLNEEFTRIDDLKGTRFYKKMEESEHWIVINGRYILKNLVVMCSLLVRGAGASSSHQSTYFRALYITGEMVETHTGLGLPGKDEIKFYSYIKRNTDIITKRIMIHEDSMARDMKKILASEPWKEMNMMELIASSQEVKKQCVETFSQTTMKFHNGIDIDTFR